MSASPRRVSLSATSQWLMLWAAVCAAHFALARLGVLMAYNGRDASLVWPAHGFAVAILLLYGPRLWSALAVASVASVLYSGAPLPSALAISTGNVLGPLAGAALLLRIDFRRSLERTRDVALLVGVGSLSATISATVGIATLVVRGVHPPEAALPYWLIWWTGDVTGLLTVAPFLLVWSRLPPWAGRRGRAAEFAASIALVAVSWLVGTGGLPLVQSGYPLLYVIFPVAIWMAIRFEQYGAVSLTLFVSAAAVWQTLHQLGPFADPDPQRTLMYLQAFVGVITGSTLILASSTAERRESERRQRSALERERAAREEAQRAVAAREKALAVVSHEVRNPLGTVLLNATSMLDSLAANEAEQRFALRSIVLSAEQIEHVVRDLNDITLLEAGRIALHQTACAPASLVSDARAMLSALVEERGLELRVRIGPALPPVLAHPRRILQVIGNLVENAIKVSPPAGHIVLDAWKDGSNVWFAVEDSGPGIEQQTADHLAQPFWDSPPSRSGRNGLGIPITRAIVAAHGGTLRIDSRPGQGCRVAFSLRVDASASAVVLSPRAR